MPIQHPQEAIKFAKPKRSIVRLTVEEVKEAFERDQRYGPILTLQQAAELAHLAPSTLKRKVSEGKFTGCVAHGKPLLFWRNRFVPQLMSR